MNSGNGMEAGRVVTGKRGFFAVGLVRFWAMVTVLASATPAFSADPALSFSGGNGAPLVITLETPVVYVVTLASENAPAFIFKNVGNFYNGIFDVEGNVTFSINGGPAASITGTQWNFSNNDVTAVDLILFPDFGPVTAGDTVTLNAGTITTIANMAAGLIPTSGTYQTFISDEPGIDIGSGEAVPEPSTWALIGLGGAVVAYRLVRRRRVA